MHQKSGPLGKVITSPGTERRVSLSPCVPLWRKVKCQLNGLSYPSRVYLSDKAWTCGPGRVPVVSVG